MTEKFQPDLMLHTALRAQVERHVRMLRARLLDAESMLIELDAEIARLRAAPVPDQAAADRPADCS